MPFTLLVWSINQYLREIVQYEKSRQKWSYFNYGGGGAKIDEKKNEEEELLYFFRKDISADIHDIILDYT